jgi:hypothetical protein
MHSADDQSLELAHAQNLGTAFARTMPTRIDVWCIGVSATSRWYIIIARSVSPESVFRRALPREIYIH